MDTNGNSPQPGRPTLNAVREPLARSLSDALYEAGKAMIVLSRAVERREIADYRTQAEQVGAHMLQLVVLCGQLSSLDEMEGGKMHGKLTPSFPARDEAAAAQIQAFRERRALERTQQRELQPEERATVENWQGQDADRDG
jgi:hypothetical protein